VQAKVIKKQDETILSLSRELELAKTEISLLKGELNLADNCPEEFRTVSNSRRKHKNVPFSLDIKFTLTNRFEPLAMLEPQTDGDSVDQPASAKSSYKPTFNQSLSIRFLYLVAVMVGVSGRGFRMLWEMHVLRPAYSSPMLT
jgi:hypothetical protein